MQIKERIENNIPIITLQGSLQVEPDAILLREVMALYMDKDIVRFVFDLGTLTYLNSWGLGLLVSLLSMTRKRGGDMRIARIQGNVQSLFIVTQLTKVFKTFDSVGEAIASFSNADQ